MIEMNATGAALAIVGGALMVAGTIYPMGFSTVHRHGMGVDGEQLTPRMTFARWRAEARNHLSMIAPWNIVGDFFRGWEGIGTTFLMLFASLCTFSWLLTGTVLFLWGTLWALS